LELAVNAVLFVITLAVVAVAVVALVLAGAAVAALARIVSELMVASYLGAA
jgi:hypothetical protein